MTTYTWNLTTKKKINQGAYSDVIVQVYWTKTGSQDGKTAVFNGCSSFSLNVEGEFIPYESVTDEMVIGWIESAVDQDHVNNRIEELLDRDVSLPPWQS